MLYRSSLLILLLAGLVLPSAALAQQPAAPPVFGYLTPPNSSILTFNGKQALRFQNIPTQMTPFLQQDMLKLARQLNTIAQQKSFQAHQLQPVVKKNHYEIHYGNQVLLRLNPAWKQYFKQSELSTLVALTNQLRTELGAERLQQFANLKEAPAHQTGYASWYGGFFHGRLTANGERYNVHRLTAAHKHLPFGTRVLVTNLDTQKSVVVKINDRGPFKPQRVIDLSPAAFKEIGYLGQGVLRVKLTVLS
ncbi:MAG: septal ring lytic transglycosylase RlpA family protein [Candidatus Sericytochromatia bacterium]|nr:septal ring lytic transglycosylase RlpA family protein [Candidatus Sericytochromatia bacterium]